MESSPKPASNKKRKPAANRSKKSASQDPSIITVPGSKKIKTEDVPIDEKEKIEEEGDSNRRKKRPADARDMNLVIVMNFGSGNFRFGLADGTPMSRPCVVAVRTSNLFNTSTQVQDQDDAAREARLIEIRKELSALSVSSNPAKKSFSVLDQEVYDQVDSSNIMSIKTSTAFF